MRSTSSAAGAAWAQHKAVTRWDCEDIQKNHSWLAKTKKPLLIHPHQVEAMSNVGAAKALFNELFTEKSGGNHFGRLPYVKVCV